MIRKLLAISILAVSALGVQAQSWVRGADISWVTEMENDGEKFYNADGVETDLFKLMSDIGMNTIRLRVWVNPENAYGKWCDIDDLVVKAKRANALGLKVLVSIHYSDFFADPSRQTKPAAWSDYSVAQLKQAVADHTTAVLTALKNEGIEPAWVQIGNETTNGMLWDEGYLWSGTESEKWQNYVGFSNAGYDAAKAVFPNIICIIHKDQAEKDNNWWFQSFTNYGGKMDMIGLSYYPDTTTDYATTSTQTCAYAKTLNSTYNVPVMFVELGVPAYQPELGGRVVSDFYTKAKSTTGVAGILYWEPEVYDWKPSYYTTVGWSAYTKGAFNSSGQPTAILDAFTNDYLYTSVNKVEADDFASGDVKTYNLMGQRVGDDAQGIVIECCGNAVRKVLRK